MTTPGNVGERYATLLSRLLDSHQWERALAVAGEWLALDPEALPAHRAAAQALVNLKQFRLASPHLQKVLSVTPDDAFACRLASIAYFHRGRHDRADECIQRAIRLQPRNAMNWHHLAWMRYQHNARITALKYALRALELAPEDANILNLVALCERTGPEQKFARYQRALELDPGNAALHNNVGAHYLHDVRDYPRAVEAFRQALALNPTDQIARHNLLLALHECDPVYRALQSPGQFCLRCYEGFGTSGIRRVLLMVFVMWWLNLIMMAVMLLWMLFGLPLLAVYGLLLKQEVEGQAGLIGTRRGGWLGFWRWPRWTRTGLLFVAYTAFWAGVFVFLRHVLPSRSELPPFFYDEPRTR